MTEDEVEMGEEEPVPVTEGLWTFERVTFEDDSGGWHVLDAPQLACWADYDPNAFFVIDGGRLRRLRSDWVSTVVDSEDSIVGYLYHPAGRSSGHAPVPFMPSEVVHDAT